MEKITLSEIKTKTGEWIKNHPGKTLPALIDFIMAILLIKVCIIMYFVFSNDKIIFVPIIFFLLGAALFIILPRKFIYQFIGRHNKRLLIDFTNNLIKEKKSDRIFYEPKDKMLAEIKEKNRLTFSGVGQMSNPDDHRKIIQLISKKTGEDFKDYFAQKQKNRQEINNLEDIVKKLNEKKSWRWKH